LPPSRFGTRTRAGSPTSRPGPLPGGQRAWEAAVTPWGNACGILGSPPGMAGRQPPIPVRRPFCSPRSRAPRRRRRRPAALYAPHDAPGTGRPRTCLVPSAASSARVFVAKLLADAPPPVPTELACPPAPRRLAPGDDRTAHAPHPPRSTLHASRATAHSSPARARAVLLYCRLAEPLNPPSASNRTGVDADRRRGSARLRGPRGIFAAILLASAASSQAMR